MRTRSRFEYPWSELPSPVSEASSAISVLLVVERHRREGRLVTDGGRAHEHEDRPGAGQVTVGHLLEGADVLLAGPGHQLGDQRVPLVVDGHGLEVTPGAEAAGEK